MLKWVNALVMVAMAVKCCFAISCYNCDSTVSPKCVNLTDRALKPELCTYDKLVSDEKSARLSWLMTVSEMNYFRGSSAVEIPMVCQKVVGTDETNGHQTTLRRCQLQNVLSCDFARNQVIKNGNKRIDHCSVCETDNCNVATHMAGSHNAAGMILVLMTAVGLAIMSVIV